MRRFKENLEYLGYNNIEGLPALANVGHNVIEELISGKIDINFRNLVSEHMIAIQHSGSLDQDCISVNLYDAGVDVVKVFLTDFILKYGEMDLTSMLVFLYENQFMKRLSKFADAAEFEKHGSIIVNSISTLEMDILDEIKIMDLLESEEFKSSVYYLGSMVQDLYTKVYVTLNSVVDFKEEYNCNKDFYDFFIKEIVIYTTVDVLNLAVSTCHPKMLKMFNVNGVYLDHVCTTNVLDFLEDYKDMFTIDKAILSETNLVTYEGLEDFLKDIVLDVSVNSDHDKALKNILLGDCLNTALGFRECYGKNIYEEVIKNF